MPCYVYLLSNPWRTVLYTGVTRDLLRRLAEHRGKVAQGFTKRYNVTDLLYFEAFDDVHAALTREKQLKAGPRAQKERLIASANPGWKDLSDELFLP